MFICSPARVVFWVKSKARSDKRAFCFTRDYFFFLRNGENIICTPIYKKRQASRKRRKRSSSSFCPVVWSAPITSNDPPPKNIFIECLRTKVLTPRPTFRNATNTKLSKIHHGMVINRNRSAATKYLPIALAIYHPSCVYVLSRISL